MSISAWQAALAPFGTAFLLVALNELGDKSQLLAIAFASRMRFAKVMAGILLATLANHGLAVAAGTLLARAPGFGEWAGFFAAIAFLFFGLLALRPEKGSVQSIRTRRGSRLSGVFTVAAAFFFAEMGDKTQLAVIGLSAQFAAAPLWVLAGAAAGMLAADSLGIAAGTFLQKKYSRRFCRLLSALTFFAFGFIGLFIGLTLLCRFAPPGAAAVTVLAAAVLAVPGSRLWRSGKTA